MAAANSASWLVRARPVPDARVRLFCFPYSGGGPAVFRAWPDELPRDIEVVTVQLPGRAALVQQPPFDRMAPLIDVLATSMRAVLDRPFAFFGHSLGALVAFELARELRRSGAPLPCHLFASARAAPQVTPRLGALHRLPETEFVDRLQELYGGIPDAVRAEPELLRLFLPGLRADLTLNETYHLTDEPPLDCAISAFGGTHDPAVSRDGLAAWREQTCGPFALRLFAGQHLFVNTARPQLLQAIAEALRTVDSPPSRQGAAAAQAGHAAGATTPASANPATTPAPWPPHVRASHLPGLSGTGRVLEARDLCKGYRMGDREVAALRGAQLGIDQGELIVVHGPSGSGKSTLLNLLGGQEVASSGSLRHRGQELGRDDDAALTAYRRAKVGFVFRFFHVIPTLTVRENVAREAARGEQPMRVEEALALVGLAGRIDHPAAQLSPGEQQRLAIARAVVKRPDLVLCDEPTGALDAESARGVLALLRQINVELGTTLVVATRNPLLGQMADRVFALARGTLAEVTERRAYARG